jgi:hypothetical protein
MGGRVLNLDGDVHAGWEVQLFEFVHRLGRRFDDVQEALVGALLEGLLRFGASARR